jgi:hypothetical protein
MSPVRDTSLTTAKDTPTAARVALSQKSYAAGSGLNPTPPHGRGVLAVALGQLALGYLATRLLAAVHHDRVGERCEPHHDYEDVDGEREAPAYPNGF